MHVSSLGCADHKFEKHGKAGRKRWFGRRPKVRGIAMNAVDHKHGGGKGGKTSGSPTPPPSHTWYHPNDRQCMVRNPFHYMSEKLGGGGGGVLHELRGDLTLADRSAF